jgi:hypothetical protein
MTRKNILSGWRVTGNWPISRSKALRHPEIQEDKESRIETSPEPRPYLGSDDTPYNSRQIHDLSKNKTPTTRRRYAVIAKGFEAQQQELAAHTTKIAALEEEIARLKRGKKRKAIPNPNRRFIALCEALVGDKAIPEDRDEESISNVVDSDSEEEEEAVEAPANIVVSRPLQITTRSGRVVKKNNDMNKESIIYRLI